MRALAALVFVVVVTGVALATPVPMLAVTDGVTSRAVWLDDGERYRYSYVNSVYEAPVEERHLRSNDRLRITSVRSPDIRAVEYFHWEGEPHRVGDAWEQDAPRNETRRLTIRVTPRSQQRLAGDRWSIDLGTAFTEDVIQVTADRLPILTALMRGWRP